MKADTLQWVGGEHAFALPLSSLEALQSRCDGDGVGLIHQRLSSSQFKVSDVVATLALGLQGGGMEQQSAVAKVRDLYEDHGLNALAVTAFAVLSVALNGWPDEGDTASGEATGEILQNP
ncbi:gene transfer agent family protein [Thalassobius sp. I31.1]|uniref:gene transfer agent family protein n=1 Tax=Thalassobius sp. I31.1 TaxID=2109912 RepID=UPI000D1BE2FD|nr:gene transfer agent family protein [Thalassobius sp. I31.1]